MALQIFFSVKYCPTNTTGITIFSVYFSMSVQIGFETGHFPANIARVFTLFLSMNFLVILQYSRWLERFITDIAFMSEFFVFTLHVSSIRSIFILNSFPHFSHLMIWLLWNVCYYVSADSRYWRIPFYYMNN